VNDAALKGDWKLHIWSGYLCRGEVGQNICEHNICVLFNNQDTVTG